MNQEVKATTVKTAALVAVLALCTSPALGQEQPHIVKRPTGLELGRFYPEAAMSAGVDGRARMTCIADQAGMLKQCTIAHEWPLNYHFGDAALKLAPFFQVSGPGPFKTTINFRTPIANQTTLFVRNKTNGLNLRLIARPTPKQIGDAYPGKGTTILKANILCTLNAEGRLEACTSNWAGQPADLTQAGLRLALLYRSEPPPPEFVGAAAPLTLTLVPPDPEAPPPPNP